MSKILFAFLLLSFFLIPNILDNAFAENSSLRFELTYANGDRVSLRNANLIIESNDGEIFQEIKGSSSEHYFTTELPIDKRYAISAFVNDMLVGTRYFSLDNQINDIIKIPINPSVGMKFFVYYNDGKTPIENASLTLSTHKGSLIQTVTTDADGKTQRFWISSTRGSDEYYDVEISISEGIVYKYPQVKLTSGSNDFQIITSWPTMVDYITIHARNENSLNLYWDKNYVVEIYDGRELIKTVTFNRGDAHIPSLKIGNYQVYLFEQSKPLTILANTTISVTNNYNDYNIIVVNPISLKNDIETTDKKSESFKKEIQTPLNSFNDSYKELDSLHDFSTLTWVKQSSSGIQSNNSEFFLELESEGDGSVVFSRSKAFSLIDLTDKKIKFSYQVDKPSSLDEFWIYFSGDDFKSSWHTFKIPLTGISSNSKMTQIFELNDASITGISELSKISQTQIRIKDKSTESIHVQISDFDVIDSKDTTLIQNTSATSLEWVKTNANWRSQEQIDDNTFIQGIEYLIQNKIIVIPQIQQETSESQEIPSWIRNNAAWWADGQIDDETFVHGIQFLINEGILTV